MRCYDCEAAPEVQVAEECDWTFENFDKHGAIVIHGIQVAACPACGAHCPIIPRMFMLIEMVQQGNREVWWLPSATGLTLGRWEASDPRYNQEE